MENQHYNNTFANFETGNSSEQLYPIERTDSNGQYWNDLMIEALGPNSHDGMPNNVDGDCDHQHMEL